MKEDLMGKSILKPKSEWSLDEKNEKILNLKAKKALLYVMSKVESNQVQNYKTTRRKTHLNHAIV